MCTCLVITVAKSIDVVQVDSLIKIPSELQVRQELQGSWNKFNPTIFQI